MPHADDPYRVLFPTVEKTVWGDDDFPVRKFREFGNDSAGIGELFKRRNPCPARSRNCLAALGLSRVMYAMAARNCARADGVN